MFNNMEEQLKPLRVERDELKTQMGNNDQIIKMQNTLETLREDIVEMNNHVESNEKLK